MKNKKAKHTTATCFAESPLLCLCFCLSSASTRFSASRPVNYSFLLFPVLLFAHLAVAIPALAWDRPFNNAANWGGTGLMEIPTARVLEDGVVRVGAAQALPYRWYSGAMGIFPGLEFSGRLTQITNIISEMEGYGSNKDKAFDVKYQILPEFKQLPAVALGVHDFWGTQQFPAKYLVFSRQLFPFDFTIGVGSDRLKGLSIPGSDSYGLFGGFEVALNERLNLTAEYNPVDYSRDKRSVRGVPEGATSPVNLGIRTKIFPGMDLGLSYQRGNTLGLMFHVQTELGKPVVPPTADPPPQVPVDRRPFSERDIHDLINQVHEAIVQAGFSDVSVYTDGKDLIAEFENEKYFSNQKAAGRVLRILLFHSPSDTGNLSAVLRRRDMPVLKVSVNPGHLEKYLFGRIPEDIFFSRLLTIETTESAVEPGTEFVNTGREKKPGYDFYIKPSFGTYLNDPSGFFKYRPGIKPTANVELWKGALGHVRYDIPFYSNISSSNKPPPYAVRSDSWLYSERDYVFDRLIVDQSVRLSRKTFGRLSMGYFESMYAGIGGELLSFFGQGRLAAGIEADWVMKREVRSNFGLLDFRRHSVLGNFYYNIPGPDITMKIQYGRFLAGDTGCMLDLSRQYSTGAVLGAYFSFTDTDIFPDSYNRGYNNKGIYLRLPAKIFSKQDTRRVYNYSISPWTRDVAATVFKWQELYGSVNDLTPGTFKDGISDLKQ